MRIMLVSPGVPTEYRWAPLGLGSLASNLSLDHEVKIFDLNWASRVALHAAAKLDAPDLIGISCLTSQYYEVTGLIEELRKWSPGSKIVVGGAHPTVMPEDFQDLADYVVRGEGELALQMIADGKARPGLITGESVSNIDSLKRPARDLMDPRLWKHGYQSMITSRGCPGNCSFCQPGLRLAFGARIRQRSPGLIVEEMWELRNKYHAKRVKFEDDTFTWNPGWILDFCDRLRNAHMGMKWDCNSRVTGISLMLLDAMKRAGCGRINFGVESGSQKVLDYYQKRATVDQTREAFRLCHRVGIQTHAYLILGAPMEDWGTIRQTEALIKEIRPDSLYVTYLKPMPGTYLYQSLQKENRLLKDDSSWETYAYTDSTPSIRMDYLTEAMLRKARKRIMRGFYLKSLRNPAWCLRALRSYPRDFLLGKLNMISSSPGGS